MGTEKEEEGENRENRRTMNFEFLSKKAENGNGRIKKHEKTQKSHNAVMKVFPKWFIKVVWPTANFVRRN